MTCSLFRIRCGTRSYRLWRLAVCIAAAGWFAVPAAAQEEIPGLPGPPEDPAPQSEAIETPGTPVPITTTALDLDSSDPERRRVGALQFAGAVEVLSIDPYVGGLSGLAVSRDGARFLAISDRGTWFAGQFIYEDGRLTGLNNVTRAPMLDWKGQGLSFGDNDSEGLTLVGDRIVVSFEGFHRLWRYSLPDPDYFETVFRQTALALGNVDGLADQPDNGGVEAVAALPQGGVLAISEEARDAAGHNRAWWIRADETLNLAWPVSDDFRPTDAAALDNGDLLVLERRFSLLGGVAARLRHVPASSVQAGGVLEPETLAVLEPPLAVDNMEGLAVFREGDGYRLILVSDDNFNVLQRTLVMSFLWRPEARTASE